MDSTVCGCGSVETFLTSVESAPVCESCEVGRPEGPPPACSADPQRGLRLGLFRALE